MNFSEKNSSLPAIDVKLKKNNRNFASKTLKPFLLLLAFLLVSNTTQAQFFKNLQKKAEDKIAREAEKRAERRVNKKIDKTFDKAEKEIDDVGNQKNKNGEKSIELPNSYHFEWQYTLKMESEESKKKNKTANDMHITYYLNSKTAVFGSKFKMSDKNPMGDMLMIMDPETGMNLMLMDMNGQKITQKMPMLKNDNEASENDISKKYTIQKADTKVILGYTCQGFKITSDEGVSIIYIAKNTPISFSKMLSGNSKFKPKDFNIAWLKEFENGLMMEMQFTSTKKKKHNMKMSCVSLVKKPLTINMSDYNSFGK